LTIDRTIFTLAVLSWNSGFLLTFITHVFFIHIDYQYNNMNENTARYTLCWSSQLTIDSEALSDYQ